MEAGGALGGLNQQPRVLITGGFGYVGGRLAQHLTASGFQVVLGSRSSRNPPAWLPQAEVVELLWEDEDALAKACRDVNVVIHAAGMNAQDCAADPVAALNFNGVATARLVQASQRSGVTRFIYFSTAHVYRSPLTGEIDEQSCPRNLHPYAATHLAGEHALMSATRGDHGMAGIVLRLSNVIGRPASADVNCWMLLVNDLCKEAVVEQTMTIRGNPNDVRDFVSMATLCKVCACLIDQQQYSGPQLHNIGSGQAISIRQMADLIAERVEKRSGKPPELRIATPSSSLSAGLTYTTIPFTCAVESDELDILSEEIDRLLQFCELNFR